MKDAEREGDEHARNEHVMRAGLHIHQRLATEQSAGTFGKMHCGIG